MAATETGPGRFAVRGILLAAFAYSCARSAVLGFTHDEALTYLLFVRGDFGGIFRPAGPLLSNSHLLNSLLMKVFSGAFGTTEFVLRFPALLGHALYLAGVAVLVRRFLTGGLRILGAALLATSPFLLDFFSLARGYALGLGFSMLALSLILARAAAPPAPGTRAAAAGTTALLTLAVLSNLSFAHVFCVLAVVLFFTETAQRRALGPGGTGSALLGAARLLGPPFAVGVLVLLAAYPPVGPQITSTLYGYGGTRGFWADTAASAVSCFLHDRPFPWLTPALFTTAVAALLLAGTVSLVRGLRTPAPLAPALVGLAVIETVLAGLAVSMVLQFHLRGVPYGVDRTAIAFIPFFLGLLLLLAEALHSAGTGAAARLTFRLQTAAIAVLLAHQLACASFSHVYLWRADADTREAVGIVDGLIRGGPAGAPPRRLGITWQSEPATNFYRVTRSVRIEKTDRSGADGDYDFYFLNPVDRPLIHERGLTVLKEFPVSGTVLALPPGSPFAR